MQHEQEESQTETKYQTYTGGETKHYMHGL